MHAILLPGFNGAATQPILVKFAKRLEALGVTAARHALRRGRPKPGLEAEVAQLETFVTQAGPPPLILVGRSFGGRVCARFAVAQPERVKTLVLLGFPLRPPGQRRLDDERALAALRCPTLIVQGDSDDLGPLAAFRPLLRRNPALTLHVMKGAGHSFGSQEGAALTFAEQWIGDSLKLSRDTARSRRRRPR